VRHPNKPEWGLGEVLQIRDQKILVNFEHVGRKLLKSVSLIEIASTKPIKRKRTRSNPVKTSSKKTKKNTPKTSPRPKEVPEEENGPTVFGSREPSVTAEFETILKVLDRLRQDFGPTAEANTALLLYTLLQTPGVIAHDYLGTLDSELRARLIVETLQGAQGRQNGISTEH